MATTAQPRGEIQRGVVYPLTTFYQRTGIGRKAYAPRGMIVKIQRPIDILLHDAFAPGDLRENRQ